MIFPTPFVTITFFPASVLEIITMNFLNKKAKGLEQGAIRAMFDKATGMSGVISMGIGEPDMPTPRPIYEAATEALNKGITHYTPNAGAF